MKNFLFAVILLAPSFILAQTYTTPIRVNLDKTMREDRAPMMKLDRNGNIYVAWISGTDGSGNGPISMAISSDGGASFTNQVVCSDANCNSNFQRTAQFVFDTKGIIHLVWMGSRVNNQPDIWYTRSTDQGKSWTHPKTVCDANDSSKYAQDFPSVACDSSDNLYVSFLDSRETQRKTSTNVHLYTTRSTDGGMTWSVNKKADIFAGGIGGTCECCSEQMACTPDGHLYIVFRSNINNLRDIWLTRSYDKGITFQPALKLSSGDWNINACPVSGPSITLDDSEAAHIVWRDARDNTGGTNHLYYAFVPNGSLMTPMNMAFDVSGSQSPNYASIAIYGKYRVIAYETFNYGMRYILNSDALALINNRPVNVNGTSSKVFANVLFASDGTRLLCWQDDKSDAGDIYFCKETSPLTPAYVKNETTESNFRIYPNPVLKENPTFTIERSENLFASIQIVDLLGREVIASSIEAGSLSKMITLPNLRSGTYYCKITEGQSITTKVFIVE